MSRDMRAVTRDHGNYIEILLKLTVKRFESLRIINLSTLNGEIDIVWRWFLLFFYCSSCIDADIWNGVKAKVVLINSFTFLRMKIKNIIADLAHLRRKNAFHRASQSCSTNSTVNT